MAVYRNLSVSIILIGKNLVKKSPNLIKFISNFPVRIFQLSTSNNIILKPPQPRVPSLSKIVNYPHIHKSIKLHLKLVSLAFFPGIPKYLSTLLTVLCITLWISTCNYVTGWLQSTRTPILFHIRVKLFLKKSRLSVGKPVCSTKSRMVSPRAT